MNVIASPRHVDLAVTGKCNLSCSYCFFADEMVGRSDLPTERWLDLFAELGRLKVMTVCLTGGEVFMRRDLFTLIDGVIANRMRYQMLTNGTLINDKVLAQFERGKRRQRMNSIQVSIDGASASTHDKSRPDSFQRAVKGLKLLLAADYPVTVRVTVNRFNFGELEDIARFLLEEIGLPSFSTNDAFPCGATNREGKAVTLNANQKREAMRVLMALEKRYPGRIIANAGPLSTGRELARIQAAKARGIERFPGRGTLSGCGGALTQMAVLHDGAMVPCHNLSTLVMGTIGRDRIQDVWIHHPTMRALRMRRNIPLSSLDTCRDCPYQGYCAGGCPGGALYHYGTINARNPVDCLRVQLGEDPHFQLPERVDSGTMVEGVYKAGENEM